MPRLTLVAAALVSAAGLSALPVPAMAQDSGNSEDRVNMVIVYGKDECPQPRGEEITVCARKDEAERYRIPEELRGSESPQNDAWNNRVLAYEMVGRTGTLSCTPVGPSGYTGCAQQFINKAYAEKSQAPAVRFSELIAAERARRLSTIDADAAATQARVEQAEREYEARRQAQEEGAAQQGQAPAQPSASAPAPATPPAPPAGQ